MQVPDPLMRKILCLAAGSAVMLAALAFAGERGSPAKPDEPTTSKPPAAILLGTGTVQGHFNGVIARNGAQKVQLQKDTEGKQCSCRTHEI
jgi:hypothetical protein